MMQQKVSAEIAAALKAVSEEAAAILRERSVDVDVDFCWVPWANEFRVSVAGKSMVRRMWGRGPDLRAASENCLFGVWRYAAQRENVDPPGIL